MGPETLLDQDAWLEGRWFTVEGNRLTIEGNQWTAGEGPAGELGSGL